MKSPKNRFLTVAAQYGRSSETTALRGRECDRAATVRKRSALPRALTLTSQASSLKVFRGGYQMRAVFGFSGLFVIAAMAQGQVTFTKDVAPILQNRCQSCHRPDTFAPMSLLTYEEARPWAKSIKQKVLAREMPPWYIDKNVGVQHFKNDVSLSDEEIATIVKWVDAGAPKGNPADMPRPRTFDDSDQWHFDQPDLIVTLPKDQLVPAAASDRWIDVLVDPGLTEDRYIKAIEVKPIKGFRAVHHVTTSMKHDDDADDGDNVQGTFLNEYALGKNADVFPEGAGRLMKAGTKINFNLHLHPMGQETPANVALALKFYPKGYTPKSHRNHRKDRRPEGARHSTRTRTMSGSMATTRWPNPPGCYRSSRTCTTAEKPRAWKPSTRAATKWRC